MTFFQPCFMFQYCMAYWSTITFLKKHDLWDLKIKWWFIIDKKKMPKLEKIYHEVPILTFVHAIYS